MILLHLCIISLLGIIAKTESAYTSIIQTTQGPVRGEILTTSRKSLKYASFKGIPYAEPPIGKLRFMPPVEKRSWSTVLDATKGSNLCIQYDYKNLTVVGSEDCLYLNVFTPHTNFDNLAQNNLKAVMVWIHGGGFTVGRPLSYTENPDFLVEDDVVIVSFNYRLGALGFLNLQHEAASGNAALKDQNLVLKWVNKNIQKFGGNPNKVTIFGQSAGAASVDLHILSDMSTGLFSQSISMSGSPLCFYWGMQSRIDARMKAFELGSKLGVRTTSRRRLLRHLSEVSASELVLKTTQILLMPFRPTVEKRSVSKNQTFLAECAIDKYRSGRFNKGPHMMGFTSAETKSLARSDILRFATMGRQFNNNTPIPTQNIMNLPTRNLNDLITFTSDLMFASGIDSKQKFMNDHNGFPVYYYRFSYESAAVDALYPQNFGIKGVGHGEDLMYLFSTSPSKIPLDNIQDQTTISRYVRLITNFAKYGNPTPEDIQDSVLQVVWPDSGKDGISLDIGKNLTIGPRPVNHNVKIYQSLGIGTSRIMTGCL